MKIVRLVILVSSLMMGCKDSKSNLEYDRSKVKVFATQEAPLGAIHFILFENHDFKVQRFGIFESQNFDGKAIVQEDSIYLEYHDKEIDFAEISLPLKMKVDNEIIETELSNGPYYLVIRELAE
ncbi:MAG: hypothetical protein AAFP76_09490 [Bacteroidota bacterium]